MRSPENGNAAKDLAQETEARGPWRKPMLHKSASNIALSMVQHYSKQSMSNPLLDTNLSPATGACFRKPAGPAGSPRILPVPESVTEDGVLFPVEVDMKLLDERMRVMRLEAGFRQAMQADVSGLGMEEMYSAVKEVHLTSLYSISNPFLGLMTTKWYRIYNLCIGLWMFCIMCLNFDALVRHKNGVIKFRSVRLHLLDENDGLTHQHSHPHKALRIIENVTFGRTLMGYPIPSFGVAARPEDQCIGPILRGWMKRDSGSNEIGGSQYAHMSFPEEVQGNGWWISLPIVSSPLHVRFDISMLPGFEATPGDFVCHEEGSGIIKECGWVAAPANPYGTHVGLLSSSKSRGWGGDWMHEQEAHAKAGSRNLFRFSLQRAREIWLSILMKGTLSFMYISCVLFAVFHRAKVSKAIMCWGNLLCMFGAFVGVMICQGPDREVFLSKLPTFACGFLAYRADRYFLQYIVVLALLDVGFGVYYFMASAWPLPIVTMSRVGMGLIRGGWVSYVIIYMSKMRSHCLKLTAPDKKLYDNLWVEMLSDEREAVFIRKLKSLAERISKECHGKVAHQSITSGDPGQVLHRAYAQAVYIDVLLKRKVLMWAHEHGLVYCLDKKDCIAVNETKRVRWAKLKSLDRAMQKTKRVYDDDARRCVDICRQSIYFESVEKLVKVLDIISLDKEVEIVRIKNRMDPDVDSTASAGYRDVCLNVRIVTEETEWMYVSHHICEVQLIHKQIASHKSSEGHQRYVELRNCRGC